MLMLSVKLDKIKTLINRGLYNRHPTGSEFTSANAQVPYQYKLQILAAAGIFSNACVTN